LAANAFLLHSNKEQPQTLENADIQRAENSDIQKVEETSIQPVKENKWAEIVRKGRSKETPAATPAATAATLSNGKVLPVPSSPTMSLTPSVNSRNGVSVSPSRTRRSRGGARKKEDAGSGMHLRYVYEWRHC
jgi:hypothetical protein